jgi:pilus assembly protein Flp/PilA
MKRLLLKFWQDEAGATAIEYGLIAAAIAIAIILIINGLGINIAEKLTLLNASLK